MKTIVTVKGIHCSSCKVLIEDVASEIEGVQSCTVDVKTGKTTVQHTDSLAAANLKKQLKEKLAPLGEYQIG